jgi:uncharacterized protein
MLTAHELLTFEPRRPWFARRPSLVHGIAHETRVLIWTQVLAAMAADEGLNVDARVLGWAAAVHDTQRWDDGVDPEHGRRAADWIEKHPDVIPASVPLGRVAHLCRWHAAPDGVIPEMTDELRVFKDADALDRWRIGDLDPSFLRTRSAHRLINVSDALWMRTRGYPESERVFSEIVAAAVTLRILAGD